METVTKTFTITCHPKFMDKIERFLSMVFLYGAWGHSAFVGMFVDGDGSDRAKISVDCDKYRQDISLISGTSYGVEVAGEGACYLYKLGDNAPKWKSSCGVLYRDGIEYKRYKSA